MRVVSAVRSVVSTQLQRALRATRAFALSLLVISCSNNITVLDTLGAVRFVAQPINGIAGQVFTVSVELLNQKGSRFTAGSQSVSLALVGSSATLSGAATVAAVNGLATFAGLSLTVVGNNFSVLASSGSYSATSTPFSIGAAAPDAQQSSITANPSRVTTNNNTTLSLTFRDGYGNPEFGTSVSLSTTLAGSTFTPQSGTTGADGTFQSTFRTSTAGTATVTATVAGVAISLAPLTIVDVCAPVAVSFPGTVNGTLTPTGGCVLAGLPVDVYRFSASGSGASVFTVTSAFAPVFRIRRDPPGDNPAAVGSSPGTYTGRWLLPAGSYQFWISATAGSGTYTATASTTNGVVTGCLQHFLLTSVTVNGQTLATTDCALSDGSYFDEFVVFSNSPCNITMTSTAFSPFLFVKNLANNTVVATAGGATTATINLAACNAGGSNLVIQANSQLAAATGPYTLILSIQGGAVYALGRGSLRSIGLESGTEPDRRTAALSVEELRAAKGTAAGRQ